MELKTSQTSQRYISSHYPEIYKKLNLESGKWPIPLYLYIHDIADVPRCPVCGNPLSLMSFAKGFREFCCRSCALEYCRSITDNPFKSKEVQERIKQTNMKKYGTINPLKCNEIKNKMQVTMLKKYGGIGLGSEKIKNKIKQTNINNKEFLIGYDENEHWICKCPHPECKMCDEKTYVIDPRMYNSRYHIGIELCTNLLPPQPQWSSFEIKIRQWLTEMGVNYTTNDRRFGLEMDIYIPDLKLAIEVNGSYWHSIEHKTSSYHINKSLLLKDHGIRCIFVWDNYKEEDIKEFLWVVINGMISVPGLKNGSLI